MFFRAGDAINSGRTLGKNSIRAKLGWAKTRGEMIGSIGFLFADIRLAIEFLPTLGSKKQPRVLLRL